MQPQRNENNHPNMQQRIENYNTMRELARDKAYSIPYRGDESAFLACCTETLPDGPTNDYLKDNMNKYLRANRRVFWVPPSPGENNGPQDYAIQIKYRVEDEGWVRRIMVRNPATGRFKQTFVLTLPGLLLCEFLFDYRFYGPTFPNVVPNNGVLLMDYVRFHVDNPFFVDLTQEEIEEIEV